VEAAIFAHATYASRVLSPFLRTKSILNTVSVSKILVCSTSCDIFCRQINDQMLDRQTNPLQTQETPQCDETRFSTIQPSIDMTGIRNERWQ